MLVVLGLSAYVRRVGVLVVLGLSAYVCMYVCMYVELSVH